MSGCASWAHPPFLSTIPRRSYVNDKDTRASRRARYALNTTGLGRVRISTWMPDEGRWGASLLQPSTTSGASRQIADLVTWLPNATDRKMADDFLDGGADDVAWFHCDREGSRWTVTVKLLVALGSPVLANFCLQYASPMDEMTAAHPLLARLRKLQSYDWTTPEYRDLCAELGFDPDRGRPRFARRHEEMGNEILHWIGTNMVESAGRARGLSVETHRQSLVLAESMMKALSADPACRPESPLFLEARIEHFPTGVLPCRDEFLALLANGDLDEPLPVTGAAPRPADLSVPIVFLPSRYGNGVSKQLTVGRHYDPDRWEDLGYGDLRGVALQPTDADLNASPATAIAHRVLLDQGVVFLTRDEALHYLDTEAMYWAHGPRKHLPLRLPRDLPLRRLTWRDKLAWKLGEPVLPIDRQLVRRENLDLHSRPVAKAA